MPTVQEIARWIIDVFDGSQTTTIEQACDDVLRSHGFSRYAAATEASEKARYVAIHLHRLSPDDLPFEFSERDPNRLVGKQRIRPGDSPETIAARLGLALVPAMLAAVYEARDCTFERVCAALMKLSGAQDAFAGCTNDDGGIDVYGRIPLRLGDDKVKSGLLISTILQKPLLFLGQSKCYHPATKIGPAEIHQFRGAVERCLNQYENERNPPSHRVPSSYYRRREGCISIFFTTGSFTDKAISAAEAFDIILIDGMQIAQFLVLNRIAVISLEDGSLKVNDKAVEAWAAQMTAEPHHGTG